MGFFENLATTNTAATTPVQVTLGNNYAPLPEKNISYYTGLLTRLKQLRVAVSKLKKEEEGIILEISKYAEGQAILTGKNSSIYGENYGYMYGEHKKTGYNLEKLLEVMSPEQLLKIAKFTEASLISIGIPETTLNNCKVFTSSYGYSFKEVKQS